MYLISELCKGYPLFMLQFCGIKFFEKIFLFEPCPSCRNGNAGMVDVGISQSFTHFTTNCTHARCLLIGRFPLIGFFSVTLFKIKNLSVLVKELEDYTRFPPVFRNFQTEFIGFVVARFGVYDAFIQHLKTLPLPMQSMTDLCSGSGEPAMSIFRKSNRFSHLRLSDKFPKALVSNDAQIVYESQSTDVLAMEFKQGTCFTMFNAFHHFEDEEKLKIVQKIQHSGSDAFIVEILEPTFFCLLKVYFTTTVGNLLLAPFVRPFSFKRLFFTYIIPVNLITITFDGMVSVVKSRTAEQYQNLFANSGGAIKVFRFKNKLHNLIVIQIERAK
jgi:hypothetical protein